MHTLETQQENQHVTKALVAKRRQRATYYVRVGLLFVCVLAVVGFFWQTELITLPGTKTVEPQVPKNVALTPTAIQTEMTGVDKSNLPFKITASKASQNATAEKSVDLEQVIGQFSKTAEDKLNVSSNRAIYDTKGKTLQLEGQVVIQNNEGMTATMDKAAVDVETRKLRSQSPVKVITDTGEITADTLEVDNNGETIKFKGRVKATFGGDSQ